jgi:hypothetical protein
MAAILRTFLGTTRSSAGGAETVQPILPARRSRVYSDSAAVTRAPRISLISSPVSGREK